MPSIDLISLLTALIATVTALFAEDTSWWKAPLLSGAFSLITAVIAAATALVTVRGSIYAFVVYPIRVKTT